jgi:hypothetical protein
VSVDGQSWKQITIVKRKKNKMNTPTHPGIIETIKDKTVAATEGTGHVIGKVVDTTAKVLTTTAKDTAKVGSAVGTAATGLVTEVIKDTKEVVVGTEHATTAVVGGAMKAAGEVGTVVVDTVCHPVTEPAHSKKVEPKGPDLAAAKN